MTTLSVLRFPAESGFESMQRGLTPLWQEAKARGDSCAVMLNHRGAGPPSLWSDGLADENGPALVKLSGAGCLCCERTGLLGLVLAGLFRELARRSPHLPVQRTVFLLVGPAAREAGLRRQVRWMHPAPFMVWNEAGLL